VHLTVFGFVLILFVQSLLLAPNRSILDDVDESADSSALDKALRSPSPIAKQGSDCGVNESIFQGLSSSDTKEAEHLDVLVMRTALEQANAAIRQLHTELTNGKTGSSEPPVVDIPDFMNPLPEPVEDTGKHGEDFRMVNVRMLDGENFVTDWDDLTPPLPPPPDHGLRSPIVSAVLEQWTGDRALHASLVSWMDRVTAGDDIESVPPLTISSLDHQVRDGFTMHVLPLLLRRADIHVTCQTRAHRRTTYDMAVTVNRNFESAPILGLAQRYPPFRMETPDNDDWSDKFGHSDMAQRSTAHSAITDHITNARSHSPIYSSNNNNILPNGESAMSHLTDGNFAATLKPSDGQELNDALQQQQQQPGIMGALGGALGGLLSRRKYSDASSPSRPHHHDFGSSMPATLRAQLDLTSDPVPSSRPEEEQPYHRVVSAPPGRIGMTFVEFRGHAMVSDVAQDSPLLDWVFPSDILIAIDEIPVSGMRVRDIIKVLTTRKNRQRAMRVISSHAMNEFTLNTSNVNDPS
jgi:hypothetical protein